MNINEDLDAKMLDLVASAKRAKAAAHANGGAPAGEGRFLSEAQKVAFSDFGIKIKAEDLERMFPYDEINSVMRGGGRRFQEEFQAKHNRSLPIPSESKWRAISYGALSTCLPRQ